MLEFGSRREICKDFGNSEVASHLKDSTSDSSLFSEESTQLIFATTFVAFGSSREN
jgi:hypothetical protein